MVEATAAAADALKEERLHGHKERAAHWHALAADAPFDELSVVPIERAPSERKIAQREASLEGEHAKALLDMVEAAIREVCGATYPNQVDHAICRRAMPVQPAV